MKKMQMEVLDSLDLNPFIFGLTIVPIKGSVEMAKSSSAMVFASPTSTIIGDKRVWDITEKFRNVASSKCLLIKSYFF